MNTSKLLICKNLKKTYKNKKTPIDILKNISFSIKINQMVTILGESGSGKSTLLHLLAGLDLPDSGSVFFKGNNIYKLSNKKISKLRNKEFGFIYQFHHLLSDFNVLENLIVPILISGKKTKYANKIANKILIKIGLKNKKDHYPNELSGGERQRVAVARAIINKPSLIFADEPTGNLDQLNSDIVFDLLKELNKTNKTTCLIVTHDLRIAERIPQKLNIKNGFLTKST